MTHNIPKPGGTYLCHNHFNSLPGIVTHSEVDFGKCAICGYKAEVIVGNMTIFGEVLERIIVLYFNEVKRKYEITKEEIEEVTKAWMHESHGGECIIYEDEYEHFCAQCGFPLSLVRPGKYQCETPWCSSNQKEETQ